MNEIESIIKRSRDAAKTLHQESSHDLSDVADPSTNQRITSWKRAQTTLEHPVHRLMSRVGGFPPALARYFIAAYSRTGDVVLDPFCGKGTTLFEAARLGRSAFGSDIAPDAVICARAKLSPISVMDVAEYIENVHLPRVNVKVPEDVRIFYHPDTLKQLLGFRRILARDASGKSKRARIATFVTGVLLGILHGHSRVSLSLPCNQAFGMSPNYVRRYVREHGLTRPRRDVRKCLLERALTFLPLPAEMAPSIVRQASATRCDRLISTHRNKAKLILTSPPYLNRQTYLKDAWLRLWFLGEKPAELRRQSFETSNVPRFVELMREAILAMSRSLAPSGRLILVCGRAGIDVAARRESIRVGDLCLLASQAPTVKGLFVPERIINDQAPLNRGSYFAVHRGVRIGDNGDVEKRLGEDEIVILKRTKKDS